MGASRQANEVARHLATAAIVGTAAHAQNARVLQPEARPGQPTAGPAQATGGPDPAGPHVFDGGISVRAAAAEPRHQERQARRNLPLTGVTYDR